MRTASSLSSSAGNRPQTGRETDVLIALRAATGERHQVVDRTLALARPHATHSDYIDHLCLMHEWLSPLENWLGSSIRYTTLIESDLAEAGCLIENEPHAGENYRWPADATAPYRWGARYVIEGSRLGAAALYRRLRHRLASNNLRYLQGHDVASAQDWPIFLRELRAAVQGRAQISEACRGARDAFDLLLEVDRQRRTTGQSAEQA